MGEAIGFYGKSETGDVATILLNTLTKAERPLAAQELFKPVAQHLRSMQDMWQLLQNLQAADLVTHTPVKLGDTIVTGFILKKAPLSETSSEFVDYSLLKGIIPREELL